MKRSNAQVTLQPSVLRWARIRSGIELEKLAKRIGVKETAKILEWEETGTLSMSQAERLAHTTHTPVGYLYLKQPPEDRLPIPDFRTVDDAQIRTPSPDLLETVQSMQRRQAWMHDYLVENGHEALSWVGSYSPNDTVTDVAKSMRKTLGIADGWAESEPNWTHALLRLRDAIDDAGVLIVINGIVGNNTHRKLNRDEFRGFALVDAIAPLIFVNNADFKSAQMFTIAHELAHIFVGQAGVSDIDALEPSSEPIEKFCNQVAAEFLVPGAELEPIWLQVTRNENPFAVIAQRFKVSTIVAARRARELGLISTAEFLSFYSAYVDDEKRIAKKKATGGDFWNNQNVRIGRRFGEAVISAAREGRLLYTQACNLTGLRGAAFEKFAKSIGY